MDASEQLTIGELATRAGVTTRTIRFYVQEQLLPAGIQSGTQRLYGYEHYLRVRLIKLLQEEDVPLRKIRSMLGSLSLAEIRELVETGRRIGAQAESRPPVSPKELLAAVLAPRGPRRPPAAREDAEDSPEQVLLRQSLPAVDAPPPQSAAAGVWRKVVLAPGVELMYEVTGDSRRQAAVEKLIAEAAKLFSEERGGRSNE